MKRETKVTLWMLLLLAANTLQVVASTHWHSNAISAAVTSATVPDAPPVDQDHGDCALCQVAAQASTPAPPPAPWTLYVVAESSLAWVQIESSAAPATVPSHAWQGRAPPLI